MERSHGSDVTSSGEDMCAASAVPAQFPCQGTLTGLQGRRKRNHLPLCGLELLLV